MSINTVLKNSPQTNYKYLSQLYDHALGKTLRDEPIEKSLSMLLSNLFTHRDFDANGRFNGEEVLENKIKESLSLRLSEEGQKKIKAVSAALFTFLKSPNHGTAQQRWEENQADWNSRNLFTDSKKEWLNLEKKWQKNAEIWSKQSSKETTTKKEALHKIIHACEEHKAYLEKLRASSRKGMESFFDDKLDALKPLINHLNQMKLTGSPSRIDVSSQEFFKELKADINEKFEEKFKKSKQDRVFFESLLNKTENLSIFQVFKKMFTMSKPANYEFTDFQTKNLKKVLNDYIQMREQEEERGIFGFSKTQKVEAAKILRDALDYHHSNPEQAKKLVTCKDILRDGDLGKLIRDSVKSRSDNNTVSGFIDDLHEKIVNTSASKFQYR